MTTVIRPQTVRDENTKPCTQFRSGQMRPFQPVYRFDDARTGNVKIPRDTKQVVKK